MDFEKAAALATAWVDIVCEGRARIVRESTIAKPYGWVFFYQDNEVLDSGVASVQLVGNAPIIVNRNTSELRVTDTARPLEDYLAEYEKRSLLSPFNARRNLRLGKQTKKPKWDGARPAIGTFRT